MALIRVRPTVTLPPDANGRQAPIGATIWVDPDEPFVATQLGVGHLVVVGEIPKLDPDSPASAQK